MLNDKVSVQYVVFIQARMSSTRFPGKVLAPLRGKPLIMHLIDRVKRAVPLGRIAVLTSTDASDDILHQYLASNNIQVFRGELNNTFLRFRHALKKFPCKYFFRLSADSPLFDERLIHIMLAYNTYFPNDLITNVFPRTFPKGLSAELVNANTFLSIDPGALSINEREHVTTYFYHHSANYLIQNIARNAASNFRTAPCAVDTFDDLNRLESEYLSLEA